MSDVLLKKIALAQTGRRDCELQAFHGSLAPYILTRADLCTHILRAPTVPITYPVRYSQLQEFLNALRQQSAPFDGERRRTARTVTVMLNDNLYHSPTNHARIVIDPRAALEEVVQEEDDTLVINALSGRCYTFAMDDLDAWRVHDSWTYINEGEDERTLGHILNELDVVLQMPQGISECLAHRHVYMGYAPNEDEDNNSALTDLLAEYKAHLNAVNVEKEVTGLRVQCLPAVTDTLSAGGPYIWIDADASLSDVIELDDHYLRVTSVDELPFVVCRAAIRGYQVQHIRNALDQSSATAICDGTVVTILEEHLL